MNNLSDEERKLMAVNELLSKDSDTPILSLIDHIFLCIQTLSVLSADRSDLHRSDREIGERVLASLTGDLGNLLRDLVASVNEENSVQCPAHGKIACVQFGTAYHGRIIDKQLSASRGNHLLTCRNCSRHAIAHDIRFYYCDRCHYIHCIYCLPHVSVAWHLLQRVINLAPAVVTKVYPGKRLLLHEIVTRDPAQGLPLMERVINIDISMCSSLDCNQEAPLHWVCRRPHALATLQLLLSYAPNMVSQTNSEQQLPLHIAMQYASPDMILHLLEVYPEGAKLKDKSGWLPLHYAVEVKAPDAAVINACLDAFPDAASTPNPQDFFPLHLYCRNKLTQEGRVTELLLRYYPFAAWIVAGSEQELPLHIALSSTPCVRSIQALVSVNPESVMQSSAATTWSDAVSPLERAMEHLDEEAYRVAIRLMLREYPKHNPQLLSDLNWEARRSAMLISYRNNQESQETVFNVFSKQKGMHNILWELRTRCKEEWVRSMSYL